MYVKPGIEDDKITYKDAIRLLQPNLDNHTIEWFINSKDNSRN